MKRKEKKVVEHKEKCFQCGTGIEPNTGFRFSWKFIFCKNCKKFHIDGGKNGKKKGTSLLQRSKVQPV